MKLLFIICTIVLVVPILSCKKKENNKIPMEHIEADGSRNFHILFKDLIEKEQKEKQRYKKGPFDE